MDTEGPTASHHKRALSIRMHTQDYSIHPQGDAIACAIWIQNSLTGGGIIEVVWGKAKYILHRRGLPGALQAAPHS